MARLGAAMNSNTLSIDRWLGLNENPNGDTLLKPGEAADMRNFKITRDGNLQKRAGYKTIHTAKTWTGPIRGIWNGNVGGTQYTIFAAGGNIYKYDFGTSTAASMLGSGVTFADAATTFFGFGGKAYAMNGTQYLEWDGTAAGFIVPVGYRPLIAVSTVPTGGGTLLESVNKLNGLRRVQFSPNGTSTVFVLPEKGLTSIDYVKNVATGAAIAYSSSDLVNGSVTFATAPAAGTNTVEIGYTFPTTFATQVRAMKYAEMYNGAQDSRVFIYGDGSNKAFYSGLDQTGTPRADYWPDLNVVNVGASNTPITSMVRHYSSLAVYKTDSAYVIDYGQITLASGSLTAAFYITPVNRSIGNVALGQAQIVGNNPFTLFNSAVYEWKFSGAVSDERQARMISDRVKSTLSSMNLPAAVTYDDNERQEYYIIQNGTALVYNYAVDAWYKYTAYNFTALIAINGSLYGCTSTGDIALFSRFYYGDNGAAIDAYWQSGSMSFGRDYLRKYSGFIFVTMKPEQNANALVTIMTDRKSAFAVKKMARNFATFTHTNYAHMSFNTSRKPHTVRLKIKAKKFVFYQLIFKTNTNWSTVTILSADIKLRFSGDAK